MRKNKKRSLVLNRRDFLKTSSFTIASGIMLPIFSCKQQTPKNENQLSDLGMMTFVAKSTKTEKSKYYKLIVLDLNSGNYIEHPLYFKSHSINFNRHSPELAFLTAKRGNDAAVMNVRTGQILASKQSKNGRIFMGHAVFTKDPNIVVSAEAENGTGLLVFRNIRDLEIIKELPTHGGGPHMLQYFENENMVAACNTDLGKDTSVCYVDLNNGALIKRVEMFEYGLMPSHLHYGHGMLFIVGVQSITDKNTTVFIDPDKNVHSLPIPNHLRVKFKAELFNVGTDREGQFVCSAAPHGDVVSIWNFKKNEFIKVISFDEPKSAELSEDGSHFCVLDNIGVHLINAKNLEVIPSMKKFSFPKSLSPYGHPTLMTGAYKFHLDPGKIVKKI